jgi:carbonic anhydrase
MLLANLDLSVRSHGAHQIAVVAHHDCAGNPVSTQVQNDQLTRAIERISDIHPHCGVTGFWLNEDSMIELVGPA